jgi:hypothetical protein
MVADVMLAGLVALAGNLSAEYPRSSGGGGKHRRVLGLGERSFVEL